MLVLLVAALMVAVSLTAGVFAQSLAEAALYHRAQAAVAAQAQVARAIQRHYAQRQAYPASLTALQATAGYEYLRVEPALGVSYALATNLVDSEWRYDRAVAYVQAPRHLLPEAQYLAANTCGGSGETAGFTTAGSWCGPFTGAWQRLESRTEHTTDIGRIRQAMNRTLHKFADAYSASGTLPSGDLPLGGQATLAQLVNYSGLPAACHGVFLLSGVPLDCTDLFSRGAGTPRAVTLLRHSANRVSLLVDSGVRNGPSGSAVIVAVDFTV